MAVILSAQCTDARVNIVTRTLFARYPTAKALAAAPRADVERIIHSTGFYRAKARSIQGAARAIVMHHRGRVPATIEGLVALPGVARKTANVVLWHAYGKAEGIAVDTHVTRIARLLGITRHTDPVRIEKDLLKLVPAGDRGQVTHLLIDHGRAVCIARRPRCEACVLNDICPTGRRRMIANNRRGVLP